MAPLQSGATLSGMCPPQIFRAALLLFAIVLVACTDRGPATTDPGDTFALTTAPPENYPTEPPPGTIPPGFVFPVPAPLTEGNADIYAQRALFHRTGSLCFTQVDPEGGIDITAIQAMAAKLARREGLLADRRTYVGCLPDSLEALDLEPTGVVIGDVAYGIGVVAPEHAMPQLPAGTVWAPRLDGFELADRRTGWTLSGSWVAVVSRPCSVLSTTPG